MAPTLLSLGQLIQDSNREINPGGREIGVNVKPFREGSFIVDLTVFPHTQLQQFLNLVRSQSFQDVKSLLEMIGLLAGTGFGAVQVVKWLGGKPKSVEEIGPGQFRYTAGDDRSVTVNGSVHRLVSNPTITNNIYKVYAAPMEQQPSVTDVKTYIEGSQQSEVKVTRDEVPAIREFVSPSPLPTDRAETIKETTQHDVYLNPKRGSFDADPKDWSFKRGDQIVVATIKDKTFLQQYRNGEYRLNHADLLVVDLLERQRVIGTEVMKPTYEIIKVKNYIKGAHQEPLDLEEG